MELLDDFRSAVAPLMMAAHEPGPRAEMIDLLLDNGADPAAKDGEGWSVLTHAAFEGQLAIAERLLEVGAHPNALDEDGRSALHVAAKEPR